MGWRYSRAWRSPPVSALAQRCRPSSVPTWCGTPWASRLHSARNGIGIDPQYFERIFQAFQRLHNQRKYAGSGIGLAICKKIVERHGGDIWVTSETGKDATFSFSNPDLS
jgi:light-regulated signal transduction histidine kinase (bacteriophytochrome)